MDGGDRALSRVVTREQTSRTLQDPVYVDSIVPVGDAIYSRPGRKGIAVPLYVPRPCATASPRAAIIDWLAFTVHLKAHYDLKALAADLLGLFGVSRTGDSGHGWNGYSHRAMLGDYGMMAWGGAQQCDTAYVSLNAHGCALVADWEPIEAWIARIEAKISRVDLAHDDFTGETYNVDALRAWYLGDGFIGKDGRKPCSMLIGDWDNETKGRTYQIGSRASGKLLRGYEKGKQLGDAESPWFRLELELLAKNRLIPWEVLTKPGQYLAGAYPCLATLSECPSRIPASIKAAGTEYEALLRHIRRQYGQAINLVRLVEGKDLAHVLAKITRFGIPQRFVASIPFLMSQYGPTDENPDAD